MFEFELKSYFLGEIQILSFHLLMHFILYSNMVRWLLFLCSFYRQGKLKHKEVQGICQRHTVIRKSLRFETGRQVGFSSDLTASTLRHYDTLP